MVITSSPGPMPRLIKADVHARCAGTEGERRRRADLARERFLEALGLGPGGDPARTQRVDDLGDLLFADQRRGEGEEARTHRAQPVRKTSFNRYSIIDRPEDNVTVRAACKPTSR